MKLFRGLHNSPVFESGSVATIGNFDGIHLGHQALFTKLKNKAKVTGLPSVVILFEPQPLEYFLHDEAPARLSSLREKILVIKQLGIDAVWSLSFNRAFSNLSAEAFCQSILFDQMQVKYLIVGEDFRFGCERRGDFNFLAANCEKNHCQLEGDDD